MSADAQFRAFIDRILRCREAEDEAKEDTKAVYAELKAEGYDKSIVGKLIAELRSREKNSAKVDEQETLLELYRDAYQRASGTGIALTHVHAREATEQPETATKQRENVPSQHEVTDCTGPGTAVGAKQQCDTLNVTRPGEQRPPHSQQARFPSQGALEADPVPSSLGAGSADQFNDTGPHVFSDQEPVQ